MSDRSGNAQQRRVSFWRTRFGAGFLVFLIVAGLLLAYEHRMHLFTGDALLIVLLLGCVVMHMFMHGSHGNGSHADGDHLHDRPGRGE